MLTSRDKKILRYMEEYPVGLTISQAGMMFFPRGNFNYTYARQRMKTLLDMGALKYFKNPYTKEIIYYLEGQKPTVHNNTIINVYANLVYYNYRILSFKREQSFLESKIRVDALTIYQNDSGTKIAIIESSLTNPPEISLRKLETVYDNGYFQEKYGDFPLVFLLHASNKQYDSENFTVINLDLKCSDFVQKIISV